VSTRSDRPATLGRGGRSTPSARPPRGGFGRRAYHVLRVPGRARLYRPSVSRGRPSVIGGLGNGMRAERALANFDSAPAMLRALRQSRTSGRRSRTRNECDRRFVRWTVASDAAREPRLLLRRFAAVDRPRLCRPPRCLRGFLARETFFECLRFVIWGRRSSREASNCLPSTFASMACRRTSV
jgi:hypothetical protein